jgi:UDP:flavonoid glycosyltransferase YjiC (YdhE family)
MGIGFTKYIKPNNNKKPKILILPCPTSGGTLGTVGYLLAIAEKLREKADILVHTSGYCYELMERHGFNVSMAPKPIPEEKTIEVNDLIDAMLWMGLLDEGFINRSIESEIDTINTYKPDVVVSDFNLTAPLSSAYCGVPIVSLAAVPTHPKYLYKKERYGHMAEIFDEICDRLNQPRVEDVRELCYLRSDAAIATSWPEFEPELKGFPGMNYIGALVHESKNHINDIRWETKKKKIFCYLSISALPPTVYIPILSKAFPEEEYEVICSVGAGYDIDILKESKGHLKIVNWAPMDTLFPDADLVIYHGGQGTGMTAVKHQVPSIAVPGQHYERIFNADRFEELRVGTKMSTENFRPAILRRIFHELQTSQEIKKLQTISIELKKLGGADRAADIIMDLSREKSTKLNKDSLNNTL